jgi:hypothetical protein
MKDNEREYTDEAAAALDALTPKMRGFVLHWLEHGSPKAAMIANYAVDPENSRLAQKGYDMLQKPKIAHAIEVLRRDIQQRTEVTLDGLVGELADIINDNAMIRKKAINLALNGSMEDKLVIRRLDRLTALDSSAQSIAAVKQLSKMLGFEAPKVANQTNNLIQINVIKPDA